MIEDIDNIIREIKEKIKKNPKYIHPCNKEFQEDIKRYKFENGNKFITWMQHNGILKNPTDLNRKYHDDIAKIKGFKKYTEYQKQCDWEKGISSPMSENKNCPQYLGIHIAEREYARKILPTIFGGIDSEMPIKNPGYDFIVLGGYKIDCKSSSLNCVGKWQGWNITINYNKMADYFILFLFDNRESLNLMKILLIRKDEIIRGKKLNLFSNLKITNNLRTLLEFKKYDVTDKLGM